MPLGWRTPASAYDPKELVPLEPYSASDSKLIEALKGCKLLASSTEIDPGEKFFQSETGEITIDGPNGRLVLDTPRTAGGYAPAGQGVEGKKGGVRITFQGANATLWVSSLDDKPIRTSGRLLVTHLTDLQNSGIRYGETARQTLLDWGHLPYLVRAGLADVAIELEAPKNYKVWALSIGGKRLALVPSRVEGKSLVFMADVGAGPANGARMLYEVALTN